MSKKELRSSGEPVRAILRMIYMGAGELLLHFTGYPVKCNFAGSLKDLLRKWSLLTPDSCSYAARQQSVWLLCEK